MVTLCGRVEGNLPPVRGPARAAQARAAEGGQPDGVGAVRVTRPQLCGPGARGYKDDLLPVRGILGAVIRPRGRDQLHRLTAAQVLHAPGLDTPDIPVREGGGVSEEPPLR